MSGAQSYEDVLSNNALGDEPFLTHTVDGIVFKATCPCCKFERIPQAIVDVRTFPHEITGGAKFACDACIERWKLEQRADASGRPLDDARILEYAGAPAALVIEAERAIIARADKFSDVDGSDAAGRGAQHHVTQSASVLEAKRKVGNVAN